MNRVDKQPGAPRQSGGVPRGRRRYPWILLAVILVAAAVVAAAPALVSTSWGRNAAISWVNSSIPGKISAEQLSLSWLGSQSVRGLAIHDPRGQPVLKLNQFTTDLSLLAALRSRLSLGQTVVQGLSADLNFDAHGTSNLARALGTPGRAAPKGDGSAPEGGGSAPGNGGSARGGDGLLMPITGNMSLNDGRIALAASGIQPVVLENLAGTVETAGPDTPIKVALQGQSRQGELQGNITLNGEVSGLITDGKLDPAGAKVDINASVEDLPVDALDPLLGFGGTLSKALGDRTSLYLRASGGADRRNISVEARTPNGNLKLDGYMAGGRFALQKPAAAQLQLTPALVDALNPRTSGDPGPRLAKPVPLHLTLERLDVPLDPFTPANIAVQGTLEARAPIQFVGIREIGDMTLNDLRIAVDSPELGDNLRIQVDGKPVTRDKAGNLTVDAGIQRLFDDAGNLQLNGMMVQAESSITDIPTTLVDAALQQKGLLLDAVGPTFGLNLNADTDKTGNIGVSMNLDSARLHTGPVKLLVNDDVTLSQPARIRFVLGPELWRRLVGEASTYRLAEPAEWTLDLKTFKVPAPTGDAPAFQAARTQLQAALSTPAVIVNDPRNNRPTRIEALSLNLGGDTIEMLDLTGSMRLVQPGGILESLDASPLKVTLDARTGVKSDNSLKKVESTVELDSAGLKAVLNTAIDENFKRLTLTAPASINTAVTPSLLASWQDQAGPRAVLRETTRIQASLERLDVPLAPFEYAGLTAGGNARIDKLAIESPGGEITTLDDARVVFSFEGAGGGRAKFQIKGRVGSGARDPGDASLDMNAGNLLNADGELSADALSLELDGRLQQLPVALVDQILNMEGTAAATLGPTADLELNTRLDQGRGPLTLTVKAPNTRANLKAKFGDRGLTLAEPLVARLEPTPEFGRKVLAKIHPIFETTQRGEQPIRFEVPAEGVLIPIQDYEFSKMTVPEMTFDFGKLVLKSGWLLRGIVGLGQQFGKLEGVQREEWVAWFTPGVMEISNGQVHYARRLDVLLDDRLHLATWGSANVSDDRSNLILAFMPDTMERVFSITVADNDALHIPIQGRLSSPNVDFKKTAADLARLRAREEVSGENPLAGALLGAVTGRTTGGGNIPPASVTPLPWAEQLRSQDAEEEQAGQTPDEQPARTEQGTGQAEPEKPRSTEEEVIRGLIDLFGGKKKK